MSDEVIKGYGFVNFIRVESLRLQQVLGQRVDQKTFCCGNSELGAVGREGYLFDSDGEFCVSFYHLSVVHFVGTRHLVIG